MKKLLLCVTILFAVCTSETKAPVNVNVNIGSQPVWGPVGYDHVDYYYLPDIETYYYVPTRQFIYLSGGNWVFAYGLPPAYRTYNLHSGYKVVVNRPKAYIYHDVYKVKYKKYKGNNSQVIIRNSNDPRYYVVKGHPKYKANSAVNKSVSKGQAKGKGNGKGKGNNR